MNVTRTTFPKLLKHITKHIEESAFVAIDLEFTGLFHSPERNIAFLDSYEGRYGKLKESVERYMPTQYGVCCFGWDPAGACFTAQPYNFYLSPATPERPPLFKDRDFACQSSTLAYLSQAGFNFNAWIEEGIPFLSEQEEETSRKAMEMYLSTPSKEREGYGRKDHAFLAKVCEMARNLQQKIADGDQSLQKDDLGRPFSVLEPCTPKERHLLYTLLPGMVDFVQAVRLDKDNEDLPKDGPLRMRLVYLGSEEEREDVRQQLKRYQREMLHRRISEEVGFRKVLDVITEFRKPVIAHNGALDLLHTFHRFWGPAPDSCGEFTKRLHAKLPYVFDTKYIIRQLADSASSSKEKRRSFALGTWFKQLKSEAEPPVVLSPDFELYEKVSKPHEAGYDAYMTGVVFVKALGQQGVRASEILSLQQATSEEQSKSMEPNLPPSDPTSLDAPTSPSGISSSTTLFSSLNKVYLMQMANGHLGLPGPNEDRDLEEVIYLKGSFEPETALLDIMAYLSSLGLDGGQVHSHSWVDSSSLLVHLGSKKKAQSIIERFQQHQLTTTEGGHQWDLSIHSYAHFMEESRIDSSQITAELLEDESAFPLDKSMG